MNSLENFSLNNKILFFGISRISYIENTHLLYAMQHHGFVFANNESFFQLMVA